MLSFHIIMESIFYCGSIVMLSGNISTVSQEVLEKKEFLQRRMREKNYGKNLVCRQKKWKGFGKIVPDSGAMSSKADVFLAELNEAPQVIQEEEIVGHIALDWGAVGRMDPGWKNYGWFYSGSICKDEFTEIMRIEKWKRQYKICCNVCEM